MKKLLRKTKRGLIASLVFVFALSLVSPALADKGFNVKTGISGSENLIFGDALTSVGGNLLKLRNGAGADKFNIDPNGNIIVAGQITLQGGTPGAGKVLTSDANGLGSWTTPSSGLGGSGTTNYVSKFTPNGTTLGNSLIQDNGTGVGINGAPVAGVMLSIFGGYMGVDKNTGYTIKDGSGVYRWATLGSTNELNIGDTAAAGWTSGIGFDPGAAEAMRILQNGNVGIGTSVPGARLDVNPTISAASDSISVQSGLTGGSDSHNLNAAFYVPAKTVGSYDLRTRTYGLYIPRISANTSDVLVGNQNGDDSGQIAGIKIDSISSVAVNGGNYNWSNYGIWIKSLSGGNGTINQYGLKIDTVSGASVNNYGVYIAGGNKNYFAGNVGIGTTNPQVNLDVNGNIAAYNEIDEVVTNGNAGLFLNHRGYAGGSTQFRDLYIRNGKGGDVMFVQGSTARVGIGTTAPVSPLEVVGNTNWASGWRYGITATSNDYPTFRLRSLGSGKISFIGNDNDGGLYFNVNGTDSVYGTQAMEILPNGNVGINNGAPAGKLDITMGAGGGISWTGGLNLVNGSYQANFIEDTNILRIRNAGTGGIQLNTASGGYVMTVLDNGNVGIGTTNPTNGKLEVQGGSGTGVYGVGNSSGVNGNSSNIGVYGSGANYGVYGSGATGMWGSGNTGVWGQGVSYGVSGSGNTGVYGSGGAYGLYGTGTYGVYGSGTSYGVYGNGNSSGWAGYFSGNSYFSNGISLGGTSAKIGRINLLQSSGNEIDWINSDGVTASSRIFDDGDLHIRTDDHLWIDDTAGNNQAEFTGGTYKLIVNGSALANGGSFQGSDIRLKKDITPLKNSLQNILNLQGVNYYWDIQAHPNMGLTTGEQIGLIAQDVQKVLPDLVMTDPKGYEAVDYAKLSAVLVEATKEQQTQIETLKTDNQNLQAEVDNLSVRLGEIEKKLGAAK